MSRRKQIETNKILVGLIVVILVIILGYISPKLLNQIIDNPMQNEITYATSSNYLSSIPEYSLNPYIILNNNKPEFEEEKLNDKEFEKYSDLDSLGRCGVAFANICLDTMPSSNEERGNISNIKPSGWINKKYEIVDGGYLYNRCHLIGYQLSAENANEKNLITGTRYLNTEGMLPFENKIAEYVKESGNHVLYRVTPIYKGENLVASGVQMEGQSVEDNGKGICFNIYCYNVQPGITINYKTGESKKSV